MDSVIQNHCEVFNTIDICKAAGKVCFPRWLGSKRYLVLWVGCRLDQMLAGGVRVGEVLELAGPSSSGKTQVMLMNYSSSLLVVYLSLKPAHWNILMPCLDL